MPTIGPNVAKFLLGHRRMSAPASYDAYTIRNGKAGKDSTLQMQVNGQYQQIRLVAKKAPTVNLALMNLGQLEALITQMLLVAPGVEDYHGMVRHPLWQRLYQMANRQLRYLDGTTASDHTAESSIPCYRCGILLPTRLITLDHQRPQSGGEVEAVTKVLRAFHLTVAGPKGAKGQLVAAAIQEGHPKLTNQAMGRSAVTAVPTIPGRMAVAAGSTLNDRYTLNPEGCLFLSLVVASDAWSTLKTQCMHSMLNLLPACQHCNSSRGNPLKYPA
jgi:hypothetical protein